MLVQVVVVFAAGCWHGEPTPAAKPTPTSPFAAAPRVCPAVMRSELFLFVRGELFAGCSPPQFEAADVWCTGGCPLPCGAKFEANREAGFTVPRAEWLIYYNRGRYGWTQNERGSGPLRPCEYDREGRATACRIGGTQDQHYERDAKGRLIAIDVPEARYRVAFAYDARGRVVEVVRDGSVPDRSVLTYDAEGRLAGEQRFESGAPTGTITYTYAGGRFVEARGEGPGVFAQLRFAYAYDADRLVQTTHAFREGELVYRYRYDSEGRPAQVATRRTLHLGHRDEVAEWAFDYRYTCP